MDKQKTIAKEFSISGIGIHTGKPVNVIFKPAGSDSGITFVRADLPARPRVKAGVESILAVSRSPRRTSIGSADFQIQTIEHLMAALFGLGIDNIIIELDNEELPGLDGSSLNYAEKFIACGIKELDKERRYFTVKEPVLIEEDGCSIAALPSADLRISYTLSYDHPLLKAEFLETQVNPDTFRREFAAARTFCLEGEAEELKRQGFGKGANYENTLVVGKNGVIKNKLRFPDEFVRHKVLDLMGDLGLLGQPLKAHFIAIKSGHSLNLKLVKKLSDQKAKYSLGGVANAGYNPANGEVLDTAQIMQILPHRDPFLFIDKIISLDKGKRATGIKNLTINDYFFKGHFPNRPVMPGVLIVEALAQVGGVMMLAPEENRGKLAFFMALDNVKFRKTVLPGDQLVLEVEAVRIKSKTGQVHGRALVEGKVVAEADLMFALVES
jgi:UDP-3-O-[3-hydroxymyristoyl] N-acetylglucosamine deacetylase/3-hydroxyacyl-[acyl-carrier-protein] dehydratase